VHEFYDDDLVAYFEVRTTLILYSRGNRRNLFWYGEATKADLPGDAETQAGPVFVGLFW